MDTRDEMTSEALAELHALLGTLNAEQVAEYARRVDAGEFNGTSYGWKTEDDGGCGCAYGTAELIRAGAAANTEAFTRRRRVAITGDEDTYTPLEAFVDTIVLGDTPKLYDRSAALYAAVQAYRAQRAVPPADAAGSGEHGD